MADETVNNTPEQTSQASDNEASTATESTETPASAESAEQSPSPAETLASGLTLGSDTAVETEQPRSSPIIRGKIDQFGVAMGTGRRKTAVARVRIQDGEGRLTINGRNLEEYFNVERDQEDVLAPLKATETFGRLDVWVRVKGGGTTGQAGAIVLGIARALEARSPELHHILSSGGYLTRDSRMVERKKYGYKKARRSFQFSKR